MSRPALSTLSSEDLHKLLDECGAPTWRAKQLEQAVWQPYVTSLAEVKQLPAQLRATLESALLFNTVEVATEHEADKKKTVKLLCRLGDGQTVEAVAMESPATEIHHRRSTVCVSSQVGCAVGCPFCATGQMGLRRNCTAAEIVDQVRVAGGALAKRRLGPVTHVVYMGMGEPLANYAATAESLHVLTGVGGISARRITVSTSGVVPSIQRLAAEGLPVTLAVSLHAATDELRDRLVPLNKKYPLAKLIEASMGYVDATGRRLSFEWCLIAGMNDSKEQAIALRDLAYRAKAHVNVIPMNRIEGSPWGPPSTQVARAFVAELRGVRATVRDTRGASSDAACGQLRAALEQRRVVQPDGTLSRPRRVAP